MLKNPYFQKYKNWSNNAILFCVKAFPAWKPDGKRPMCAKFANYYEEKCWDPAIAEMRSDPKRPTRGKEKLQRKYET